MAYPPICRPSFLFPASLAGAAQVVGALVVVASWAATWLLFGFDTSKTWTIMASLRVESFRISESQSNRPYVYCNSVADE